MHLSLYLHTCAHTITCTHTNTHTNTHAQAHTHTHTHTHVHTRTHAHTRPHTPTPTTTSSCGGGNSLSPSPSLPPSFPCCQHLFFAKQHAKSLLSFSLPPLLPSYIISKPPIIRKEYINCPLPFLGGADSGKRGAGCVGVGMGVWVSVS
jgi:hypothetical protein